jgi:hypothetical protein
MIDDVNVSWWWDDWLFASKIKLKRIPIEEMEKYGSY